MSAQTVFPKVKLHIWSRAGQQYVRFDYKLSKDLGFCFHMLCECRDDVQEIAKRLLTERGYEWEQVELDAQPWIATRIWKKDPEVAGDHIDEKNTRIARVAEELVRGEQSRKS